MKTRRKKISKSIIPPQGTDVCNMLKSWPNISALTYMELVAASGTINQSMLAYCHYFDIVIALMYLDIQGDFFKLSHPEKF